MVQGSDHRGAGSEEGRLPSKSPELLLKESWNFVCLCLSGFGVSTFPDVHFHITEVYFDIMKAVSITAAAA